MRKAIFLFCVAGLTVQSVSASVYRLKESVPHAGHPAIPQLTAYDPVIVPEDKKHTILKISDRTRLPI